VRDEDYGWAPTDPAARPAVPPAVGLTALFVANFRELRTLAWRIVRDGATAEDVVQDSFILMHSHWDRISGLQHPQQEAYLAKVVYNRALQALRHRHRVVLLSELESELPTSADAETLALANAGSNVVTGELARLPRRQREVLSLTVDGHSPIEIADILGIEANAVRVHLHHARAKVRARLASTGVLAA
jgi:RNA polymerase sigma factor (sigma-70 family)